MAEVAERVADGVAVCAVEDEVGGSDQIGGGGGGQRLDFCRDREGAVDRPAAVGGDARFRVPAIGLCKERLPVEVRQIHGVAIDNRQPAHPCARKQRQRWCRKASGAHDQDTGLGQSVLTVRANFWQKRLAGVAGHRVALIHWRTRASGSSFRVMSVTTDTMSAPASKTPAARSTDMPPMPTRGV